MLTARFSRTPIAIAVAAAIAGSPQLLVAAETQLGTITVAEEEDDGVRVEKAASPKYTAPLRDTPQTITVVTQETIAEQNLLSLRDILSTVPGITFGAGEGGGGYGDSINLRGFAGSNDVTVDGMRDSAQYTRSDPFNLEQVEVVNGANSVYTGAGSVGGSVNLVSKTARAGDFNRATVSAGTDKYGRIAADLNRQLSDKLAVRINAVGHRNDVPGRDVEKNERWGVAPSISYGLGTDTTVSLSYLRQHDRNVPQYGVPTWEGNILPGADFDSYFGYAGVDKQLNDTDAATFVLAHNFGDGVSLRNQTRWQQTEQFALVNPPQGTYCLESGVQPNGNACPATLDPGEYLPSGPRGTTRDTTNQLLATQTDLTTNFATGPLQHTLVLGFSLSSESYDLRNGNSLRNADGSNPYASPNTLPITTIADPGSVAYDGPVNFIVSSKSRGTVKNRAVYVFENIAFTDYLSLNAGLRFEGHEASFSAVNVATPAAGGAESASGIPGGNRASLFSYRAGLVYKPLETGSLYVAYGNSETPSVATVNGTCTVAGTPPGSTTPNANPNCNVDPEKAENIEIGTKWDLLDARLSVSAAVARNNRSNYRVNEGISAENPTGQQVLDGSARVDSLLLGVAGSILPNWSIFANYALLDSKVIQGVSDNAAAGTDYTRGDPLLNTPKHSASLWTTWDVMRGVQLGYGATWQDKVYTQQHTAPTGVFPVGGRALPTAGGYVVHRLMGSYTINRSVQLQLNVNNLFDKQYLTRVRTQQLAWGTPGEARSIVLSANVTF